MIGFNPHGSDLVGVHPPRQRPIPSRSPTAGHGTAGGAHHGVLPVGPPWHLVPGPLNLVSESRGGGGLGTGSEFVSTPPREGYQTQNGPLAARPGEVQSSPTRF